MSNDTNIQLAEDAIELAEQLGEAYIQKVAHLVHVNDLDTLRVFHRAMQLSSEALRHEKDHRHPAA